MIRRYLAIVGLILVVVIGLAVWLKPPLDRMREGVEEGLTAYAKQHAKPGDAAPVVREVASHDWLVAVSHVAKVNDDLTFYCIGAFKVTICDLPE
jgi:type II secretory pathway component PulM